MHVSFFIREAMRSIRRNPIPSFAAMATVLVTLLVLGVFIPIVQAASGAADTVEHRVQLDVYMKSNATAAADARVHKLILATAHVKHVTFVSKAQALAQQRKTDPEAFQLLGSDNPLPDTFQIQPDNPSNSASITAALAPHVGGSIKPSDPAIGKVKDSQHDTDKIVKGTHILKLAMGLLIGLLAVASVLLVANTIRLSLFSRRREVEVMKLVGATDWFIRWPFLIEGMVLGALGGAGAAVLLLVGKVTFLNPLKHVFRFISVPNTIPVGVLALVLLGASVLVSAAGSGLSLRRFLRV
jgi:cell division transport system permease protein